MQTLNCNQPQNHTTLATGEPTDNEKNLKYRHYMRTKNKQINKIWSEGNNKYKTINRKRRKIAKK